MVTSQTSAQLSDSSTHRTKASSSKWPSGAGYALSIAAMSVMAYPYPLKLRAIARSPTSRDDAAARPHHGSGRSARSGCPVPSEGGAVHRAPGVRSRRRLSRGGGSVRGITVFSGSAHPELAAEICDHLGVPLSPVRSTRFANDCLGVQLQANCRERDVFLIQPLVPPVQENLVELLLMVDAARGASAARTTIVMPHYAYARSDKKDA